MIPAVGQIADAINGQREVMQAEFSLENRIRSLIHSSRCVNLNTDGSTGNDFANAVVVNRESEQKYCRENKMFCRDEIESCETASARRRRSSAGSVTFQYAEGWLTNSPHDWTLLAPGRSGPSAARATSQYPAKQFELVAGLPSEPDCNDDTYGACRGLIASAAVGARLLLVSLARSLAGWLAGGQHRPAVDP